MVPGGIMPISRQLQPRPPAPFGHCHGTNLLLTSLYSSIFFIIFIIISFIFALCSSLFIMVFISS